MVFVGGFSGINTYIRLVSPKGGFCRGMVFNRGTTVCTCTNPKSLLIVARNMIIVLMRPQPPQGAHPQHETLYMLTNLKYPLITSQSADTDWQ
jgi:hypothetical protein